MTPWFQSDWSEVGQLPEYSQKDIKDEPMFFGADLNFAHKYGGDITKTFVEKLSKLYPYSAWIVDSRVHMLKSGWMPCIPGWHVDDFYRPQNFGGQSDLWSQPRRHRVHIMAVNGTDAFTEFLSPGATFRFAKEDIEDGETVHGAGNRIINGGSLFKTSLKTGQIIQFDTHDWHRGVMATKDSWRHLIRASWFAEGFNRETSRPILNEIRNQVQVYLPAYEAGW